MCRARREAMTEYRDDIEEIEEDDERTFGEWLQDNLRIIISVIIVLLLALGIYSYSKRSQETRVGIAGEETSATTTQESETDSGILAQIGDAVKDSTQKVVDTTTNAAKKATDTMKDTAGSVATKDNAENSTATHTNAGTASNVANATLLQEDKETADAFVMVAQPGNGKTHLARRALAGYLAKNPVKGLTAAHKVYIEDYLQKAVGGSTMLMRGDNIRFSKDLIAQAITRAQKLTEAQLTNLQQFVR